MDIVEITGAELSELLRILRRVVAERDRAVHTVRVAVDGDGFKLKVNEGTWTSGYGRRREREL